MKFQKKIIIIYTLFSLVIISITSGIYYFMSANQYRDQEYANISTISNVKMQQMEDKLSSMEAAITYILSDAEVLEALQVFATLDKENSYEAVYFNEASSVIRSKITNYHTMEEFYRIVVFNRAGNVVANNNYSERAINSEASYATYPWIDEVSGKRGKNVLLGLHEDTWGNKEHPMVVSVVKEIQGMDMGYIEVQEKQKKLNEMISNTDKNTTYLFLTKKGNFVYSDNPQIDTSYYKQFIKNKRDTFREIKLSDGENGLCYKQESQNQNLILLTISHTDIGKIVIQEVLPVSLILLFGALMLSTGYVYFTSRQLTKPIHQLQRFMETTHLDNIEAEIPEKISNDEIEALYVSYKEVLSRLHESMLKEKRMSLLQLQAQFDLLQAQVNPHFIYNVLNVISNRGMISDDEVICDMCSDLAGMLRYSTNTKDKYATVKAEVQYLELYLKLLKYRYSYKLSYTIQISEPLYQRLLPKIVLQQMVENSIAHGYQGCTETIEIQVNGYEDQNGWYISISDNGCGITPERKESILRSMDNIRRKLTKDRSNVELEIGGMGLVNTYARLYLLYNDDLEFCILSDQDSGTRVVIGIKEPGREADV